MTPTERLVERLRAETSIVVPDGWTFHRTYAGRVQRSRGAISWWIQRGDGGELIGSAYPVGDLLRSPTLTIYSDRDRIPEVCPS